MRRSALSLLVLAACGGPARTPAPVIENPAAARAEIVIGHYASMTGANATFGQATDRGIQLAIEQRNAAGGIDGKTIRLVTLDDAGKPAEAATVVTRLIVEEGAQAILGEVASSLSLAGGTVAQAQGVPMISPASTRPEVTEVGPMVFRVCMLDDLQAEVGARFATGKLVASRAAILHDQTTPYSVDLARDFERHFTDLGGTIVLAQAYTGGNPDVSAQLQAIASAGADVVYLPGYYADVASILRQARDAGLAIPFLGGDGWDSAQLAELAGPALDGSFYVSHFSAAEPGPEVAAFVATYTERFGEAPDSLAALGYDAAGLLLDAMARARSLGGEDLRAAIQGTASFPGVTGTISIDAERNAHKSAVVIGHVRGTETIAARL
jgi:branched-chain amino acid transport system substrate-binding protein